MSETKDCVLYTDGSCRSNKGVKKAGYAVVILYDGKEVEHAGALSASACEGGITNQRAELYAILMALYICHSNEILKERKIIIYSDSEYAIKTINGEYKAKVNLDLVDLAKKYYSSMKVTLQHVYGHNGNKYNERCDKLAKEYT